MKKLLALVAVAGASATALTACGSGSLYVKDITPNKVTLVVAEGSRDDKSFNQGAWEGMEAAKTAAKTENNYVELKTGEEKKLKDGIMAELKKGSETLVLPGFTHGNQSLGEIAAENANRNFILLDSDGYFTDKFNSLATNNIAAVVYDVHEAAFLAGYATQVEKSNGTGEVKYGIWGGMSFASVYGFMAGFEAGAKAAAADNFGTATFIAPKDNATYKDYYAGNFNAGGGKTLADYYVGKGADILLPVAGPQTKDAIDAIKAKTGSTAQVIGVDSDAAAVYADDAQYVYTSILKDLKESVKTIVEQIYAGNRAAFGKAHVGNLDNNQIGIVKTKLNQAAKDEIVKTGVITAAKAKANACSTKYAEKC